MGRSSLRIQGLLLLLCMAPPLWACTPHTELEKVFCQLKAKGESLPSLEDFRRNQPRIQALLLKAPARRQGIALPKVVTKAKPPAPKKTVVNSKPEPRKASPAAQPVSSTPRQLPSSLSSCQLQGHLIQCPRQQFRLATNRANRYLAKGALGPDNRLGLSNYQGERQNPQALKRHLTRSYERYIEKMLSIGLGASTMSFSKFYYTHDELQQLGVDFADRFETMFGYLKKDKASMAIKDSYLDALPPGIGSCNRLKDNILVCDNGEHNWVYLSFTD
ncbi:hypothetical protein [Maricurvus nonylphenolicus]|uniref:hypothetical protein n=1 Tax=Maricurvus nonylphenolicus TaxID=1008307 RepID=UPI0036F2B79C